MPSGEACPPGRTRTQIALRTDCIVLRGTPRWSVIASRETPPRRWACEDLALFCGKVGAGMRSREKKSNVDRSSHVLFWLPSTRNQLPAARPRGSPWLSASAWRDATRYAVSPAIHASDNEASSILTKGNIADCMTNRMQRDPLGRLNLALLDVKGRGVVEDCAQAERPAPMSWARPVKEQNQVFSCAKAVNADSTCQKCGY